MNILLLGAQNPSKPLLVAERLRIKGRDGEPDEHLLPEGGGAGALGAGRHPGRGAQRGEHHFFMTIIMVVSVIS